MIVNLLLTPAVHILNMAALFGYKCSSCMVVNRKAAVKLQKLWLLSAHEIYIATVKLQCIWSCFVAKLACMCQWHVQLDIKVHITWGVQRSVSIQVNHSTFRRPKYCLGAAELRVSLTLAW